MQTVRHQQLEEFARAPRSRCRYRSPFRMVKQLGPWSQDLVRLLVHPHPSLDLGEDKILGLISLELLGIDELPPLAVAARCCSLLLAATEVWRLLLTAADHWRRLLLTAADHWRCAVAQGGSP